uniref:Uncharacterized protein n=1 Tax=Chromera velia CCMP2878 TaxID=1169474 RepID=A0A0G4FH51_9ALVE|eukprot:Cvel_16795.t1-p1 / transcript=Cvel_16795.t1 / gene=Cvel_16795 / organism=Chromera_velia_CCMP2878 / gene_product=hypothetical protein / transcript_product=hypothetical protein / location=Cvel_scaffold1311:26292-26984(-) / protein_length=231 / sequence_SO=supercontig / SO=protein_coding / is_pseudo=false
MVPPLLIPIVGKNPGQPLAGSRKTAAMGCGSPSTLGKRSWESATAAAPSASAGGRPFLTFPHLTTPRQGESFFSMPPCRQSPGQTLPEFGHDTQPRLGPNTDDGMEPTAFSLAGLPPPEAHTKAPTRQQTRKSPPEGMLMDAFVGDQGFLTGSVVRQTAKPSISLFPSLHQPPQPSRVTATLDLLPPPGFSLLFPPPVSSRPPQDSGGEDLGVMLGLSRQAAGPEGNGGSL